MNWYGRPPAISSSWPKRASSNDSVTASVSVNVVNIPSTDSNVAAASVRPAAGRLISVAVGQRRCRWTAPRPVRSAVAWIWVIAKSSRTTPVTSTRSPAVSPTGQAPVQSTDTPSEVAASPSPSASSSCTKNPLRASLVVYVEVTMPWTTTPVADQRAGRAVDPCTVGDRRESRATSTVTTRRPASWRRRRRRASAPGRRRPTGTVSAMVTVIVRDGAGRAGVDGDAVGQRAATSTSATATSSAATRG